MKFKKMSVTLLSALCAVGAYAQSEVKTQNLDNQSSTPTSEELHIDEVVLTATGTPRRLKDSPVPISVITAEDLKRGNILTMEDALLKLNPSFTVMTNGMGTTMSLNGMEDEYMVFLLNGRRMNGSNPYAQIDINRVKRIEIMPGAAGVMYGTNAIGGVVNIITDDSAQDNVISGSLQNRVSSHDRYLSSVDFTAQTEKFRSSTSYTHNESGGWQFSPYVESSGELVETEKEASTGFSRNMFSQEFQYDVNDKLTLTAQGSYYDNITKRPYSAYTYNVHHMDYTYGAGVDYKLSDKIRLRADYYSDHYFSSYDYMKASSSAGAEVGDRIVRSETHYHNANAKGFFSVGDRQEIVAGVEYEFNTLESVSNDLGFISASTISLFAQDEVRIVNNFYALAGVRYVYHQTFNSNVTAHASLRYSIKGLNLRASYSSGYKTPSLSDIYAEYESSSSGIIVLPNEDLNPERSNYFSLNAEYTNKWVSVSATGFYNKVYDMIDYETLLTDDDAEAEYGEGVSEVRIRSNIARAEVKGINIALNVMPGAGLNFGMGYTGLDAVDLETGEPINRSVENVVVANASWVKEWNRYALNMSISGRWSDERYSSSYGYAPAYQTWDFTTCHTFKYGRIAFEPSVGVENIFDYVDDRPWNSNYATLNPGRSLFAALRIKF